MKCSSGLNPWALVGGMGKMLNKGTSDALVYILIEKIYPRHPDLMRNDRKAAKTVSDYLDALRVAKRKTTKGFIVSSSNSVEEIVLTLEIAKPLLQLGREALRKYIRHLWATGEISSFLEFKRCQYFDDEFP